jgi:hypothetical protein
MPLPSKRERLAEIRRRLGPYAQLQNSEPWRLCDAEIARRLVEVVNLLDEVLAEGGLR